MPQRRAHLTPETTHGQLAASLAALRLDNNVPAEFPAEVLAEAERAASEAHELPALDLRDVPFVTLDPRGSRDLDQAFHLDRGTGGAWLLRYAIADVPAFVRPGGAVDEEARRRGQTLYLPDGVVPLHPPVLSEDRASLLPGTDRTAYVWTIPLSPPGSAQFEGASVEIARVERARIRSRAQLSYEAAQQVLDTGAAHDAPAESQQLEMLDRLAEFGKLRVAHERARGGASLNMPDEEVVRDTSGYRIERRFPLPVEEWNAQLSLLTGMVAAHLMLEGGVGILRTMPAPDEQTINEFRDRVSALGMPWPARMRYGEYLDSVPRDTGLGIAVLHAASSLFRGAGYSVFGAPDDSGAPLTLAVSPEQAAIAAPYAHVTAPLRRLVDRWGLVVCEALSTGSEVPAWAMTSLHELPALMRSSSALAGRLGAESLDRVEAALLRDRVGDRLGATVVDASPERARVQIGEPPVTAYARLGAGVARPASGSHVDVAVIRADVSSGTIELELG